MGLNKLVKRMSDRSIYLIIYILVVILIADTSIVKISAFVGGLNYYQDFYTTLFAGVIASFIIIQFIVLQSIQQKYLINVAQKKLRLRPVTLLGKSANYALASILLIILFQMISASNYNTILMLATIWISYGMTFIVLGFLCILFLRWLRYSRSPVIIAYAIAILTVTINSAITIGFLSTEIGPLNSKIEPSSSPVGSLSLSSMSAGNILYNVTSVLSFILTWVATVILLHHYSKVMGRAKYWLIVSIPLVYFLASFQPLIVDFLLPLRLAEPILFGVVYTLFFSATQPVGAILFGIAFWAIARSLTNRILINYMLLCSYGMIILFTANQPLGLLLKPYPPFGLVTISFMPLASYLMLIGIYSAAISVSQDSTLRESIRKTAMKHLDLIDRIGFAETAKTIEEKVMFTTKKVKDLFENESGVATSLDLESMKSYMNQVLEELKTKKSGD